MSDIAMLVAEEYERRVKNSRKNGEEIELFNFVSVFIRRFDQNKKRIGEDKGEINVKWALEPKSQVGLAALNGFFSA